MKTRSKLSSYLSHRVVFLLDSVAHRTGKENHVFFCGRRNLEEKAEKLCLNLEKLKEAEIANGNLN